MLQENSYSLKINVFRRPAVLRRGAPLRSMMQIKANVCNPLKSKTKLGPLYSTDSILFCATLLYSIRFYSTLFYSILFYSALLYSILFDAAFEMFFFSDSQCIPQISKKNYCHGRSAVNSGYFFFNAEKKTR